MNVQYRAFRPHAFATSHKVRTDIERMIALQSIGSWKT